MSCVTQINSVNVFIVVATLVLSYDVNVIKLVWVFGINKFLQQSIVSSFRGSALQLKLATKKAKEFNHLRS